MYNLVGTGLNQLPTNSMLGGMAYQSPDHASIKDLDLKNLSQINSEIADTAVDIFVYDTRKDSDGGAWRKRTQSTSWYNETLNTATRGARREFPAVAVIVAEDAKLVIYDGDDPDLPMWMVFNLLGAVGANSNMIPRGGSGSESDITSIAYLNGRLAVGLKDVNGNVGEGLAVIDFISELARIHRGSASGYTGAIYGVPISGRNSNNVYSGDYNSLAVVDETINDVSMTVLPNAPIDPSTGLPIPTIAVATDGGFSVIKDDGTVIDKAVISTVTNKVDWYKGQYLLGTGPEYWGLWKDLSEESSGYISGHADLYSAGNQPSWDKPQPIGQETKVLAVGDLIAGGSTTAYNSRQPGLSLKQPTSNLSNGSSNLLCEIRKDYNTGWMHGDIKGAFLSDTDATNVTGTELWPEGDFADANEWSSAGAEWTISGGTATVSDGDGGYSFLGSSTGTLTNGKKYVLSFTVSNYSGGRLEASQANSSNIQIPFSANGSYSQLINYTGTTGSGLGMYGYGGGAVGFTLDNLYLRELEVQDRSVNNTGLAVYGTVTKSAVATGAELVAYSGFSGNNVLVQPYNSSLDPGTGDYSFMFWFKCSPVSGEQMIMRRFGVPTVTGGMMMRVVSSTSVLQWYVRDTSSSATTVQSPNAIDDGNWHCAVGTRQGSTANLYLDGVLVNTSTCSANSHDPGTTADLVIGAEEVSASPGTYQNPADLCSLALVRYSLSAPSAEQIKKIYEDEKVLFQENAKCTLYGTSDAVTALAYDDSASLLHVGTSSGRSEFKGLRRVGNTTTAVTTAISASSGLVAEQ